MTVNMHEAKTHLSRLVERALAGEEIIIAKNGKGLLTLKPLDSAVRHRTPGLSAGQGAMSEDFDVSLPESLLQGFE